jgi:NAD(P)-dependent dehydrogenase (short-subunit alcohol dehydrogenase family)
MSKLDGRHVVVSGAAGGLGTGLCARLARDGARLLATDVSVQKGEALLAALAEAGVPEGRCNFIVLDQSDGDCVAATMAEAIARFGAPDALVNNAAVYPTMPTEELPYELFMQVQTVNVGGAVALLKSCLPGLKASGDGRVINISSITFDSGYRNLSAYVAAKGALIGLARVWARDLGPYGATVNAVSPGAFPTDAEKIHPDPDKYTQFVLDQQAVKRRGTSEDFAGLVAFLLGPDAGFISGQTIRVDGGWIMA